MHNVGYSISDDSNSNWILSSTDDNKIEKRLSGDDIGRSQTLNKKYKVNSEFYIYHNKLKKLNDVVLLLPQLW